jgi:hypothetical protein
MMLPYTLAQRGGNEADIVARKSRPQISLLEESALGTGCVCGHHEHALIGRRLFLCCKKAALNLAACAGMR